MAAVHRPAVRGTDVTAPARAPGPPSALAGSAGAARRVATALAASVLLLALGGCEGDALGVTWVRDGRLEVVDGARQPGVLLVTGGDVELAAGSRADGPILLLGGSLAIDGEVGSDVLAPAGRLRLGPGARLAGDLGVGTEPGAPGPALDLHPDAVVAGELRIGLGALPSAVDAGRWGGGGRVLLQALAVALLGAAWARWGRRRLAAMADAAGTHAVVSASLGALTLAIGLVAVVVMAFTIVLIPAALASLALGGFAVASGWAALGYALLGRWSERTAPAGRLRAWLAARPVARAAAGGLGVALLLGVVERLPWVGGALALAVAVTALGAVALTGFGGRRYEPPSLEPEA